MHTKQLQNLKRTPRVNCVTNILRTLDGSILHVGLRYWNTLDGAGFNLYDTGLWDLKPCAMVLPAGLNSRVNSIAVC